MKKNPEIKYIKIDFNNNKHISILTKFNNELYIKEFANEDEAESLENLINQAKSMIESNKNNYHCIIAISENEKENDIIGGIIGDYFWECNSGVIEYIVVSPNKRKMNIGSSLISILFDYFNEDAKISSNNIFNSFDFCFFECENPNKVNLDIKDLCLSRCHFWDKKMDIN